MSAITPEGLSGRLRGDDDPLVFPAHDPGSPDPPVAMRLSEVVDRNVDLGRSREAFIDALSSDIPDHPPNFQRVKRVNVGTGGSTKKSSQPSKPDRIGVRPSECLKSHE